MNDQSYNARRHFWNNLLIVVIYFLLVVGTMVIGIIDPQLTTTVSFLFEISAVILLIIDEKYKLDNNSRIYGKLYTSLNKIFSAPSRTIMNWRILKIGVNRKGDLRLEMKVKEIPNNPSTIEERVSVLEADMMKVRDFSYLRLTAYIFIGIGFVFQFVSSLEFAS